MELLAWAREQRPRFQVVGSGSNLLIADEGVRGLVIKLDGELAEISIDGERISAGGGARLPPSPRAAPARACRGSSSA